MIDPALEERLQAIGVDVHAGATLDIDPHAPGYKGFPAVSIWRQSEPPTHEEIALLGDLVNLAFSRVGKTPGQHFRRFGIDPWLIRKADGLWQFRRASWDQSFDWAGNAPLTKIVLQS